MGRFNASMTRIFAPGVIEELTKAVLNMLILIAFIFVCSEDVYCLLILTFS